MSFDITVLTANWPLFAWGLAQTLCVCLVAIPCGFAVGTVLTLGARLGGGALQWITRVYVEVVRNVPFVLQVLLLYFALPAIGIRMGAQSAGITALVCYTAAYSSEILRG